LQAVYLSFGDKASVLQPLAETYLEYLDLESRKRRDTAGT